MELEKLMEEVQDLALVNGAVVYAFLHRNAGWAVHWHEGARVPAGLVQSDAWRQGLVIYEYRPTLREALEFEKERLSKAAPRG